MRTLLIITALALTGCGYTVTPTEEGAGLYMERGFGETFRAQFQDATDCQLVADTMQREEPLARWYCR